MTRNSVNNPEMLTHLMKLPLDSDWQLWNDFRNLYFNWSLIDFEFILEFLETREK